MHAAADTPRCLSPFSSSESLASKIECFSSVPTPHKRHSVLLWNESHECDMIRLIIDHGEKPGLLFTDVGHELLDSPYSSVSDDDYSSR